MDATCGGVAALSEPAARLDGAVLRLWRHLGRRRRRQFELLAVLMLASAFSEVLSLGALLPFLAILTDPAAALQRPVVARAAHWLGVSSPDRLALPLTVAFVAAAVTAGALRVALVWISSRLAFACGTDLSVEAYRRTLLQPYHVHTLRNSSEVISTLTNKVRDVIFGVLLSGLTLISSSVVILALVAALIVMNPLLAFLAAGGFGAIYGSITWAARRRLALNSRRIADEQSRVVKAMQEGLGGIRNVLLDGTQRFYCDLYREADLRLRRAQGENDFIGASPRFVMEGAGMALIATLAYGLSRSPGGMAAAVPLLGGLALGAQRLIPAMQLFYAAWASISGNRASLCDVLALLDQPAPAEPARRAPLALRDEIRLDGVRFRYVVAGPWVLDGVDLRVRKGTRVGLVGATGSGKSTALDILMGLLPPGEGRLLVDGGAIEGERVSAWQSMIAHVPQAIFLADSTIAENIAFGVPRGAIDPQRLRRAARQAQIADFIEAGPKGYEARVGEHGIQLSGGQRQRIGIARALYKRADVLVFDEATSALDSSTERAVMEAIGALDRSLTVLMVAHRLATVRLCDVIFELEGGRVVAQGTYDELLASSPTFRRMAQPAALDARRREPPGKP